MLSPNIKRLKKSYLDNAKIKPRVSTKRSIFDGQLGLYLDISNYDEFLDITPKTIGVTYNFTFKLLPFKKEKNSKDFSDAERVSFFFRKHVHKTMPLNRNCLTNIDKPCKLCYDINAYLFENVILQALVINSYDKSHIGKIKLIELKRNIFEDEILPIFEDIYHNSIVKLSVERVQPTLPDTSTTLYTLEVDDFDEYKDKMLIDTDLIISNSFCEETIIEFLYDEKAYDLEQLHKENDDVSCIEFKEDVQNLDEDFNPLVYEPSFKKEEILSNSEFVENDKRLKNIVIQKEISKKYPLFIDPEIEIV